MSELDADALLASKPILRSKLQAACRVDAEGARDILVEVVRFLSLCAESPAALTPSPRVDDAWHELVLCTRLYAEFCERRFGRFIHHDPGGTREDNAEQFRDTMRRYVAAYGSPDPRFWGEVPTADCGGCQG